MPLLIITYKLRKHLSELNRWFPTDKRKRKRKDYDFLLFVGLPQHFYSEPRAAKDLLGWKGSTNLAEDLKERFEEYVKIGRDEKPMNFELDDKILESLKVPVAV